MSSCRVFLSYAHESAAFREDIRRLALWLEANGVQVISDFAYDVRPPVLGWVTWMLHSLDEADVVLVVCTPRLKARYEKRELPDVGAGATFEGAVITQSIYEGAQRNSKFYPVLPDGGAREDIPVTLRAFDNNHRFPSGNGRILQLVQEALGLAAPSPAPRAVPMVPGRLCGASDNRLAPRGSEVVGREAEIGRVLDFLRGKEGAAVVCAQVTGTGGIGKTEICKAAIRRWLMEDASTPVFFIDVPDTADAPVLIERMGAALNVGAVTDFGALRPQLQPGVYYLDNLESIAELHEGRHVLKLLRDTPGVRLLASSRVSLPGNLGRSIAVDALPLEAAVAVFRDSWTGEEVPPDSATLREFLARDLGCHALSVTLMARLGESYGVDSLIALWRQRGTSVSRDVFDGVTRHGSLAVSLALTAERLKEVPGALLLWVLSAIFEKGVPERTVARFELAATTPTETRQHLTRHHIWKLQDGRFRLLPPVARFALDEAKAERNGFSWRSTRIHALPYLETDAAELEPDEISAREGAALRALLMEVDTAQSAEQAVARIDAQRRDFVANVSHSLRTPLTVLAGFIELLQTHPVSDTERDRALRIMAQQAAQMSAMSGELLLLARLEESGEAEAPGWSDLSPVLEAIKAEAEILSDGRHRLSFPEVGTASIAMPSHLLHCAISNLVCNAITFTPPGERITVNWARSGPSGGELSVRDTGIGIAAEHLPRLTERFYCVDRGHTRKAAGSGLGLAIVREIMMRVGGQLQIYSEVGEGSRFCLIFPPDRTRMDSREH